MTDDEHAAEDLDSLEGIRVAFARRFEGYDRGYHALGEQVMKRYYEADGQAKPASAMTFRNFLQGKTSLRDPTGLLLYFECLGADAPQMQRIRGTLQQALDRRIAAPAKQPALAAFRESDLEQMPYSRALAECEAATHFEAHTSTPIAAVAPLHYLLGPGCKRDAGPDRNNWGLLQHMDAVQRFLEDLELKLQDAFAAAAPSNAAERRWLAAAAVREAGDAYAAYLLRFPAYAELMLSRRRHILHGPMPEKERQVAIGSVKRSFRTLYRVFERFAQEVVLDGDRKQKARTPDGEIAMEIVGERLMSAVQGFYMTTVLGSTGTGGLFAAMQQSRREFADEPLKGPAGWSGDHQALVDTNDSVQRRARQMVEGNARVRYGEVKRLFETQDDSFFQHCYAVWHQDFGQVLVRQTGTLLAGELHNRGQLSDREVVAFYKFFLTSKDGLRLHSARHQPSLFDLSTSD